MQTKLIRVLFFCYLGLARRGVQGGQYNLISQLQSENRLDGVTNNETGKSHSFFLCGASGDLSKREIYPALWYLYRDGQLPDDTRIYGYARSNYTLDDIREKVKPYVIVKAGEEKLYESFWLLNKYMKASDNQTADYEKFGRIMDKAEAKAGGNRVFYFAIPPSSFSQTASDIKNGAMAKKGWTRLIVEKPFGHDLQSSEELSQNLTSLFTEEQIYRMDHFLGYEMVRNLLTLRFANRAFQSSWNKDNIAAIEIDFRENFGVEGRGGYFDEYGIIRDVMQNHLLQIMTLIAMEKPKSMSSADVRDAKVNFLKETKKIVIDDVVIGQYIGNPKSEDPRERVGYREDPSVPKDSITATFALTVLKVNNKRWQGVPFIIRAGKGLGDNKTEVIIQYKDVANNMFPHYMDRNELIIRIGKTEALQAHLLTKTPGFSDDIEKIKLDFDYRNEFKDAYIPEAYVRLLSDVFAGVQTDFVRSDELREAWRIFTPILHEIDDKKLKPINYKFGTAGPKKADEIEKKNNFIRYNLQEKLGRNKNKKFY